MDFLRDFQDVVLPFMEEGVRALKRLLSILVGLDPEHAQQAYENIRRAIQETSQNLDLAEKAATDKLEEVNGHYSKLTVDKCTLQKEKENMTSDLSNLNIELSENRQMLERSRNELEEARNDVQSKQKTLDELHAKMEEDDRNTKIGIGLMFVPFIGPIIGELVAFGLAT
jgi:chromosome segregation ATPase